MLLRTPEVNAIDDYLSLSAVDAPANRIALILAGGDGLRLQELTREITGAPIPKQYCRLLHGASLLEATILRTHFFAPRERIAVIVNRNHIEIAADQLRSLPESNIIVQPCNRDTGPGLAFALLHLHKVHPDAIVGVFPSDHYVDNDREFILHVLYAASLVSRFPDKIAILGIAPDRLETEYGYIVPENPLPGWKRAYRVRAFAEKPTVTAAADIVARGGLWNTFVMVFKIASMLQLLCDHFPDDLYMLSALREAPEKANDVYRVIDAWNCSKHLLARVPDHLIAIEVTNVRWSDWGTRESIERSYRIMKIPPSWSSGKKVVPATNDPH